MSTKTAEEVEQLNKMYRLVQGELLLAAYPLSKTVISAYDHAATHDENVAVLSSTKFLLPTLESCAAFLDLKTHNPDKIYHNKHVGEMWGK